MDDQVRGQLDRMLAHSLFSGADRRARLLRFLIEQTLAGQAEALKESVLAVEVFDRPAAHDPKIDSLVRVEMGRLRSRLIEYYAQAGSSDPVRIEIPRGSYAPVFHLTEPVLQQLEDAAPAPSLPPTRAPRFVIASAVIAALCAISALVWYGRSPVKPLSVAVLPFLNLTGDPASEYLSDGVTDELTGVLAEAGSLKVVARTSAFQFKGKGQDIREIGRLLNAGALLEGSIARTKDKYRIVAQLIRASDGYHLWAESFDFLPGELQAAEGEVARATVRTLAADQPNFIASSSLMSTKDPEAHELALRARSAFLRGTIESVARSIQLAQQAIDKDPSYAVPYYLRGIGESTLGRFGVISSRESLERSLASFDQAIKLNPSFGDAHATHAANAYFYNWDWPPAEEEFKLALRQGSLEAPNLYGALLTIRGRFEEAHRQLVRAEEQDPVAAAPRLNRAGLWATQLDFGKAREEYQRVLEQNPQELSAIIGLAVVDVVEKNCPAAEAESAKLDRISAELSFSQTTRAYVWASCGKADEARKLRDKLDASPPPALSYFAMALVDGQLQDYDRGFVHLGKAADALDGGVLTIKANPFFKPFAADPRYVALVKRLHLDQ